MARLLFAWLVAAFLLPTPAAAQWQYEEGGGEARAYVMGQNGTSFGFRCTSEAVDRQNILLDLMVIPSAGIEDVEDVVQFEIGTWTFNVETVRAAMNGRLARYQSRFPFFDSVTENMRRQVKGGSAVRFTRSFDFALMSFSLRGSRNAMERLEAACPRLWAGGGTGGGAGVPLPQASAPPVGAGSGFVATDLGATPIAPGGGGGSGADLTAPAWQFSRTAGRSVSALMPGGNDVSLMLSCDPDRVGNELVWVISARTRGTPQAFGELPVRMLLDGDPFPLQSVQRDRLTAQHTAFIVPMDLERHGGLIAAFAHGWSVELPDQDLISGGRFFSGGSTEALDQVLGACGAPDVVHFTGLHPRDGSPNSSVNTWRASRSNGLQSRIWLVSADGHWVTLSCAGQGNLQFEISLFRREGVTWPDRIDAAVTIGGRNFPLLDGASGRPDMGARQYYSFVLPPDAAAPLLSALAVPGARAEIPATELIESASFASLAGAERVAELSTTCSGGAPPASIPPQALEVLGDYIASLVAPQCAPGSTPEVSGGSMMMQGARVSAFPGRTGCAWASGVNPYCRGQVCQMWVYEFDGAAFTLVETGER